MNTQFEGLKEMMAHQQGDAFNDALELLKSLDPSVETMVGDYIITLAFEKAAGWYIYEPNGELRWVVPEEKDNLHLEVIVQDANDLRFLPYLEVSVKLFDKNKELVGEKEQEFIWHPMIWHYAENWQIPGPGEYFAEITVKEPTFRRHDQLRGQRYMMDATIKLEPFEIPKSVIGQKPLGPE